MSVVQTITKQETQTAVTIKSVKIENLFEIFDYDIEYADGENVLILTGPNGFGKTTILNVLYNLFNRKFHFFYNLVFDKILVELNEGTSVEILRKTNDKEIVEKLMFSFFQKGKLISKYNYYNYLNKLIEEINQLSFLTPAEGTVWIDKRGSGRIFNLDAIADENQEVIPLTVKFDLIEKVESIINSIGIHLIKEQRLLKKPNSWIITREKLESIVVDANELKEVINNLSVKSYNISQNLDSTYTTRLISEKRKITKEEYNKRFEILQAKQNKLIKYGLYEKQSSLEYSKDDAKALLVYLDDLEKKLSVFDELLAKLDLFTEILNKHRFTFKVIKINNEKGFYFETSKGKSLKMNGLSSGERHQVILLYELIFNTTPNTLVLIDEPEISLHITWQKEFVKDLLKIIKIQNFQVMIATHAPAIVNGRWDLVYNLGKDI